MLSTVESAVGLVRDVVAAGKVGGCQAELAEHLVEATVAVHLVEATVAV